MLNGKSGKAPTNHWMRERVEDTGTKLWAEGRAWVQTEAREESPLANISNSLMSGTTLSEEPCTPLPSALSCLVSKQTLLLGCHLFLPSCTAWTSMSMPCFVITCMLLDTRLCTLNWSSSLKGQRWIPCFQAQSIYFSLFNLFTDCNFQHSNILEIPPLPLLLDQNPHLKLSLIYSRCCSSPNHHQ